jgi:hypothetical protein
MKKSKTIIFKIHGRSIEEIDGDDITIDQAEKMKTNLAIMHCVSYDDVEVDTQDIFTPEISSLVVRADGTFMQYKHGIPNPILVKGISPSMDIYQEELFDEFLGLISKGDIDKAIIFR